MADRVFIVFITLTDMADDGPYVQSIHCTREYADEALARWKRKHPHGVGEVQQFIVS